MAAVGAPHNLVGWALGPGCLGTPGYTCSQDDIQSLQIEQQKTDESSLTPARREAGAAVKRQLSVRGPPYQWYLGRWQRWQVFSRLLAIPNQISVFVNPQTEPAALVTRWGCPPSWGTG